MQSLEGVLTRLGESRIIHLVRSPWAVALSRYKFHVSGRSEFTKAGRSRIEQLGRESSIYCRQVVEDVQWSRRLEQRFPGRLYLLTYEQLVQDPVGKATEIYQFIGYQTTPASFQKFSSLAAPGNNTYTGSQMATKWQKTLTDNEKLRICKECRQLLQLFPEYDYINTSVSC